MLATQIHPRVFQVAAPFEGGGLVNCYLIDAPRRTLVDTGTASVPKASLLPALAELVTAAKANPRETSCMNFRSLSWENANTFSRPDGGLQATLTLPLPPLATGAG